MDTMSTLKLLKSVEYCTNLSEKIDKDMVDLKSQLKLISKKFENLNKLHEYSRLKYDWNFNGAEPFTEDVIELSWEKLNDLEIQPEVFPTACGSVQFEYEKDNKDYLEFEIYQDRIEVFKIINENEEEFDLNVSEDLNDIVNEFYNFDKDER
jgi:hypothetical protein